MKDDNPELTLGLKREDNISFECFWFISETEFFFETHERFKSLNTPILQMTASSITPKGSVNNLGVIFEHCINMYEYVTSIC